MTDKEFYDLPADTRRRMTLDARERGAPLLIRWGTVEADFGDRWVSRARAAASHLSDVVSVADVGCGTMTLEQFLGLHQVYIPVDLVQRDARTCVLDLNISADLGRLPKADACALLGVVEYLYDPVAVIRALRARYNRTIVSYNTHDKTKGSDHRLEQGWVNNFDYEEFVQMFEHCGFSLLNKADIGDRTIQNIYKFA